MVLETSHQAVNQKNFPQKERVIYQERNGHIPFFLIAITDNSSETTVVREVHQLSSAQVVKNKIEKKARKLVARLKKLKVNYSHFLDKMALQAQYIGVYWIKSPIGRKATR